MASPESGPSKKSKKERLALLYRNFNIVGAVALAGAAILLPVSAAVGTVLVAGAGLDVLQAGGGELAYRAAKKADQKKKSQ